MLAASAIFLTTVWFGGESAYASSFKIVPTFDASITGDPNSAAIECTIDTAISTYESLFTNPITVAIYFQEGGGLGGSTTGYYNLGYANFLAGLTAEYALTGNSNQGTALAHLPAGPNNP